MPVKVTLKNTPSSHPISSDPVKRLRKRASNYDAGSTKFIQNFVSKFEIIFEFEF